jgi:hypothetical protein
LGTKLCFASVYHPQSNGAVERANGVIFAGIKRNITDLPKSKWAEELPRVIWSHNFPHGGGFVVPLRIREV